MEVRPVTVSEVAVLVLQFLSGRPEFEKTHRVFEVESKTMVQSLDAPRPVKDLMLVLNEYVEFKTQVAARSALVQSRCFGSIGAGRNDVGNSGDLGLAGNVMQRLWMLLDDYAREREVLYEGATATAADQVASSHTSHTAKPRISRKQARQSRSAARTATVDFSSTGPMEQQVERPSGPSVPGNLQTQPWTPGRNCASDSDISGNGSTFGNNGSVGGRVNTTSISVVSSARTQQSPSKKRKMSRPRRAATTQHPTSVLGSQLQSSPQRLQAPGSPALPERAFQQLLTNPEVHHALAEHATSHLLQDAGGQPNFDGLPLSLDSILSDLGQLGDSQNVALSDLFGGDSRGPWASEPRVPPPPPPPSALTAQHNARDTEGDVHYAESEGRLNETVQHCLLREQLDKSILDKGENHHSNHNEEQEQRIGRDAQETDLSQHQSKHQSCELQEEGQAKVARDQQDEQERQDQQEHEPSHGHESEEREGQKRQELLGQEDLLLTQVQPQQVRIVDAVDRYAAAFLDKLSYD